MARDDLLKLITHGEHETTAAQGTMHAHPAGYTGCCDTCGQAWPCDPYREAAFYVTYWNKRLTLHRQQLDTMAELAGAVR